MLEQQQHSSSLLHEMRSGSAAHDSSNNIRSNSSQSPIKLPLDESDATSMTTASTSATPSPFHLSGSSGHEHDDRDRLRAAMAPSPVTHNPTCHSSPQDEINSSNGPRDRSSFSMLSALTATPRRKGPSSSSSTTSNNTTITSPAMTPPGEDGIGRSSVGIMEGQDSWSDSSEEEQEDDNVDYEGDHEHDNGNERMMSPRRSRHQDHTIHKSSSTSKTPPTRRTSWSIQQALFPDEEAEHRTPPTTSSSNTTTRRPYHRSASDSPTEYNNSSHRHLWTTPPSAAASPPALEATVSESQAPIRTRRSRRATVARVDVDQDLLFTPEQQHHRRRNSTGEGGRHKYRASPVPSSSAAVHADNTNDSSHHSSHPKNADGNSNSHHHPKLLPELLHSHSKCKKLKQQRHKSLGLELPGLLTLEERLARVASNTSLEHSSENRSSSTCSAAHKTSSFCSWSFLWRSKLCKIRLTTLVWGLVLIGVASLGKSALVTSSSYGAMAAANVTPKLEAPAPPTTGGLRGSLLLATVGRQHRSQSQSQSSDHQAAAAPVPKPRTATNTKKDKPKKNKDKHNTESATTTTANNGKTKQTANGDKHKAVPVKKDKVDPKTSSGHTVAASSRRKKAKDTQKSISVARPKPLDPSVALPQEQRRTFEEHDPSMFNTAASVPTSNSNKGNPSRVLMLHGDDAPSQSKHPNSPRSVQQYPAEFTDNTQFYSQFDSSDERLRKMERRAPYEQDECVPMQDWQTTFHPSCNGVHELGVENLGEESTETDVQLFGTKGYWRYAWKLDLRKQGRRKFSEQIGDRVVLKTLKFRHDFEDAHFEHDRIDAVAMERLTSSPHVINLFGFCGHSVLTEYANGPRLGELADKSKSKPLARLKIARDIANGLADVHGIDGDDGKNATFVHLDINPANVVSIGGTLKLNDFNIGIIRRWNTTSQEPCGFPAQYPNPQWRSPEEARSENNLTEKVDVFSMGHIFFRLICGHEPWNKLEPGGKPSKDVINEKVEQGKLPSIPEDVLKTEDPEVAAIRDAMLDCYQPDPKDRPSSREIAKKLEVALEKLATE